MAQKGQYYRELTPSGFGIAIKIKDVLFSEQSKYQKIEIIDTDSQLGKMITLNGLMYATEGDEYYYSEMVTHVPLLNHKCPKTVLVIGGGTGSTTKEILKHDTIEKITIVDIDEMVVSTCKKYLPSISSGLDDPRVEVLIMDAFEYIKDKHDLFDVILITTPNPLGPGVGQFTNQFYQNIKAALRKDGILVVQSESPVAKDEDTISLYKLLLQEFNLVETYSSPLPTYPGGYWAWAICSDSDYPFEALDEERCEKISKQCKLYTKKYHEKCFKNQTLLEDLK